jgi:hypothetical protein
MNIGEIIRQFTAIFQTTIQSPKVGAGTAITTTGTGIGTIFDYIPDDIGKLATLIGIVLSLVLIRIHLVKLEIAKLERDKLKDEE